MSEGPADMAAAEPRLHNYRLSTLNGLIIDFATPHELVTLWSIIVRDGWMVTPEDFVPYHAIAHIKLLPPPKPENGPRVVPFMNRT